LRLKLDIDLDIVAMMAAEVVAGERAVTAAMREAGTQDCLAYADHWCRARTTACELDPQPELPEVGRKL